MLFQVFLVYICVSSLSAPIMLMILSLFLNQNTRTCKQSSSTIRSFHRTVQLTTVPKKKKELQIHKLIYKNNNNIFYVNTVGFKANIACGAV